MTMRWRVLHRDGAWRLIDVEVHGLWLAIEQRAQIMALLDKQDTQIADLYFVASTD
jgi:phospholipid transport system substrate-binding protein